jgi:ankyrin repeat protein
MIFSCNSYLRSLLLIFLLSISFCSYSQNVELDTTEVLETPLSYRQQIDMNNYLMIAAASDQVELIHWLIKNGAEVNSKTNENVTPLIFAVAHNNFEATKTLLKYNADVNVMSSFSETPLLIAVKNGNLEIAEALIRDSADINIKDLHETTPLHYAAIYGFFYIVDMLLYYDAPCNIKAKDGITPLMAAAWAGFADIANILIQNGANCKEKDNQGFTPFMLAAQNGDTILMEILIRKGVNLYEVNNFNYDALDICIKSNQKKAVEYLFRKGYNWNFKLTNTVNPCSVATKYLRKEIMPTLEKNQIPKSYRFGFDQVALSASLKICFHDYYSGFNFAFKEPYINGGIIIGYDFKPGYTRVLYKADNNSFFQYREKSSIVYSGIFKDIVLTDYPLKGNWSFTASVSAAYTFGNKFKGTNIFPEEKFKIIPSTGFKWTKNKLCLSGNLEFMNTDLYKVGPIWARLGFSYNLFFDNDRAPGKDIKWY